MERLAIIVRLKDGAEAQARELVRHGPPFDPGELGVDSHAVYLTGDEAVFVFEGPAVEGAVADLLEGRSGSPTFAAWTPLLDGTPRIAREGYYWRRTG